MYTRILLSILLMLPMLANAEEVEIDGLWYNLSPKEKTAEVIQYKDTRYAGDVIIPATVTYKGVEYSVTSIAGSAFHWCKDLTSITIGDNVKRIENNAFRSCNSLTTITIPSSVTTVGSQAFLDCNLLNAVNITDLEAWNRILFFDWSSNPLAYARHLYLNGEEVKGKVKSE